MNLTQDQLDEMNLHFTAADQTSDMAEGNQDDYKEIDIEDSVRQRVALENQLEAAQELHNDDVYTQQQVGSQQTQEQQEQQGQTQQNQQGQQTQTQQQTQQRTETTEQAQSLSEFVAQHNISSEQLGEMTLKVGENDVKVSDLLTIGDQATVLHQKNQEFDKAMGFITEKAKEYEDITNKEYIAASAVIDDVMGNVEKLAGGADLEKLKNENQAAYLVRMRELDEIKESLNTIKEKSAEKYGEITEAKNKEYFELHNAKIASVYSGNDELLKKTITVLESTNIPMDEDIKVYDSRMFGLIAELTFLREEVHKFKSERKEVRGEHTQTQVQGQQSRQQQQAQSQQGRYTNPEDDLLNVIADNIELKQSA